MIARRRKRPRVKSCTFHTLGWLIRREAALRIIWPEPEQLGNRRIRARLCSLDTRRLLRAVGHELHHNPKRRHYP